MLCDVMAKLHTFKKVNQYRYVGFGSPYFADFSLFHKKLGIKDLVSIEKDKHNEDRFLFNKPFSCIEMLFEDSHNALPKLDWEKKPTILWLDYDGKIDKHKLADINTFFSKAESGSMFIISMNVQPDLVAEVNAKALRHDKLIDAVGSEKLPIDIEKYTLSLSDNYLALRDIINMEIDTTINIRNGGVRENEKVHYHQIINFLYSDNALMLTLGGILYNNQQEDLFKKMELSDYEFIRESSDVFKITVPCLTFKEIHALDSLLPDKISNKGKFKLLGDEKIKPPKLVEKDVIDYCKIYKYFPNFAEANF